MMHKEEICLQFTLHINFTYVHITCTCTMYMHFNIVMFTSYLPQVQKFKYQYFSKKNLMDPLFFH